MSKFIVTIKTEELKGRLSATRTIDCRTLDDAEQVMEREYGVIARRHELLVDEDITDRERVVEYVPRMRTTLTISEA